MKDQKGNFDLLKASFLKKYVIIQIIFSNNLPNYYLQNDEIATQHKIIYVIEINNWLTALSTEKKN